MGGVGGDDELAETARAVGMSRAAAQAALQRGALAEALASTREAARLVAAQMQRDGVEAPAAEPATAPAASCTAM